MNEVDKLCYNVPGSPIYGEITAESMNKIACQMPLSNNMCLIDIGSGSGNMLRHFAMKLPVQSVVGVEVCQQRATISKAKLQRKLQIPWIIYCDDIFTWKCLPAGVTHSVSFDITFPPALVKHIQFIQKQSKTLQVVVSNHNEDFLHVLSHQHFLKKNVFTKLTVGGPFPPQKKTIFFSKKTNEITKKKGKLQKEKGGGVMYDKIICLCLAIIAVCFVVSLVIWNFVMLHEHVASDDTYIFMLHDQIVKCIQATKINDGYTSLLVITEALAVINALSKMAGGDSLLSFRSKINVQKVINTINLQKNRILSTLPMDTDLHKFIISQT